MNATSDQWPLTAVYPIRVFALIMFLVFAVEGMIMVLLPHFPWLAGSRLREGLIDATLLTLAIAPAIWWLAVRPMQQLFEARGQLLHRVFHAQEQERARIARDLHDEIGQHLTAILVGLKTIEASPDLPTAKTRAEELRDVAALAHSEVRRLARGLRPGVLEELRLEPAIERICEEFQTAHGIPIELKIEPGACDHLATDCETALYRIVQEALTNAARHSRATGIEVSLACRDNKTVLRISDNGRGFSAMPSAGSAQGAGKIGLASIRERALMLGGQFLVHSEPNRGTTVQVTIPTAEHRDDKNSRPHRG
jgi:two-component system sensor histidine kinase UhpB